MHSRYNCSASTIQQISVYVRLRVGLRVEDPETAGSDYSALDTSIQGMCLASDFLGGGNLFGRYPYLEENAVAIFSYLLFPLARTV